MPRFTHLPKKAAKNLVCFENPDVFKEYPYKPKVCFYLMNNICYYH